VRRIPSTPEGKTALEQELRRLREVVRPQIIEDLATARAHGDLRENSEYEDAKHRHSLNEGRIQEVESILGRIEVIDPSEGSGDTIRFGATVRMLLDGEDERVYKLVGEHESDTKKLRISVTAPLARAIIGKTVDDIIYLGDDSDVEILEIRWE